MRPKGHLLILFLVALMAVSSAAQVQRGVVKTRGRMVAGKRVSGQGLPGAVVQVEGRNAIGVKNADGSFSFPVTGKQFTLKSVSLKGYQLLDADAIPKKYHLSPDPIVIVMESPSSLKTDKQATQLTVKRIQESERMKRKMAREAELRKEIREIEKKMQHGEYLRELKRKQAELHRLENEQEAHHKQSGFIGETIDTELARHLSQLDYDQMDSSECQIVQSIMDGNLAKADSLLRVKGDIATRIKQTNQQANEQTSKELEDLGQDCYWMYAIFRLKEEDDSAATYIKHRAMLDTTDANWQIDAGKFLLYHKRDYHSAQSFFVRSMNAHVMMTDSTDARLASDYSNLGWTYIGLQNDSLAQDYFTRAIEIFKMKPAEDCYRELISCYKGMRKICLSRDDDGKAKEYNEKAEELLLQYDAEASSKAKKYMQEKLARERYEREKQSRTEQLSE